MFLEKTRRSLLLVIDVDLCTSFSYVGRDLKKYGLQLGRITGLDPAEPHFEKTHPMVRLDETDAFYVDVIHTDANPLMSLGLGLTTSGSASMLRLQ